tara:strand:+ start:371 stop:1474 length:1104 start_codon:yes stop_codon:yes gene_type:complete
MKKRFEYSRYKKILRELYRFFNQIIFSPIYIFQFFFNNIIYKFFFAHKKKETAGHLPQTNKIAIYLIFPKKGLEKTHLNSLNLLISKGFSPIVISNCFLKKDDVTEIKKRCFHLIERSNFGYDFGGYRDAIIFLKNKLTSLNKLILINDSVYCLVSREKKDWFDFVNSSSFDFIGATSHGSLKKPSYKEVENLNNIVRRIDKNTRNFHYASYALGFSEKILQDKNFFDFWNNIRLTKIKNKVVRRGEIGLTRWVIKNNYSHGSWIETEKVIEDFFALSKDKLLEISSDLSVENGQTLEVKRYYSNIINELSKKEIINFLYFHISRYNLAYSLTNYLVKDLGFSFIKKRSLDIDNKIKDFYLENISKN